jgi:hypothetical protein
MIVIKRELFYTYIICINKKILQGFKNLEGLRFLFTRDYIVAPSRNNKYENINGI